MYCIHGSDKSVRYVSRAHLTHLWTGGDIMDVLSLAGILNLILMKAQQERAFLCLLLHLRRRRTARLRQFLVRSLYLPPPPRGHLSPRRSNCELLQLPSLKFLTYLKYFTVQPAKVQVVAYSFTVISDARGHYDTQTRH